MTEPARQTLGPLAWLVLLCAVALIIAGIAWHGITAATLLRLWRNLIDRPTASVRFRFFLQPVMATAVGIRDGRADARAGRAPYLATVFANSRERIGRLREGLNATARVILLGLVMDMIYQLLELKTFFPNEAIIIALLLAFVPYVIVRSLAARILRGLPSVRKPS